MTKYVRGKKIKQIHNLSLYEHPIFVGLPGDHTYIVAAPDGRILEEYYRPELAILFMQRTWDFVKHKPAWATEPSNVDLQENNYHYENGRLVRGL
jgi:hypothetical protein